MTGGPAGGLVPERHLSALQDAACQGSFFPPLPKPEAAWLPNPPYFSDLGSRQSPTGAQHDLCHAEWHGVLSTFCCPLTTVQQDQHRRVLSPFPLSDTRTGQDRKTSTQGLIHPQFA